MDCEGSNPRDTIAESAALVVASADAVKKATKPTPAKATKKKATTKKVSKPLPVATAPKKKAAKKSVKKVAKKVTTAKKEGAGRTCQFAGKKLTKVAKENPRREGTHGFNSFKIIKDGMTYEQYLAKGGRLVDLVWDVEKGNVKVK